MSQAAATQDRYQAASSRRIHCRRELGSATCPSLCQPADLGVDAVPQAVFGSARRSGRAAVAVLVISQDLDESRGRYRDRGDLGSRLSASYPAGQLTREKIGLLMGGTHGAGKELEPSMRIELEKARPGLECSVLPRRCWRCF